MGGVAPHVPHPLGRPGMCNLWLRVLRGRLCCGLQPLSLSMVVGLGVDSVLSTLTALSIVSWCAGRLFRRVAGDCFVTFGVIVCPISASLLIVGCTDTDSFISRVSRWVIVS